MDTLDRILHFEDLSDDERAQLADSLRSDPDARKAMARWAWMLNRVRHEVNDRLPDRRLLVLEGMRRHAGADFLLSEDGEAVASSADTLRDALVQHPGLEAVVSNVVADAVAFDAAWSEASANESADPMRPAGRRRLDRMPARPNRRILRWSWRVGAALAVLAFASVLVLLTQRESGLTTIATAENEVRSITLADGSRVRLLGNSRLAFHAEEGATFNRYARLEGRAFFEIVPEREGFAIDLPTARVVVLGTTFGVRADPDTSEVYLASGRVSVTSHAARSAPVVLEAGEMTSIVQGGAPARPQPTDISRALSWTGLLIFRDAPVEEVARRLEETYGLDVHFDEALRTETLTGTFERAQVAEDVLVSIASALGAEVERQGARHILRVR